MVDACPNVTSFSLESSDCRDAQCDRPACLVNGVSCLKVKLNDFLSTLPVKSLEISLVRNRLFSVVDLSEFDNFDFWQSIASLESLSITDQFRFNGKLSINTFVKYPYFQTLKRLELDVPIENPAFQWLTNLEYLSMKRLRLTDPANFDRELEYPGSVWPDKLATLRISADRAVDYPFLYKWLFGSDLKEKTSLKEVHIRMSLLIWEEAKFRQLPTPARDVINGLLLIGIERFKSLFFIVRGYDDWKLYFDLLHSHVYHDLESLTICLDEDATDWGGILAAPPRVSTYISHLILESRSRLDVNEALKIASSFGRVKMYELSCHSSPTDHRPSANDGPDRWNACAGPSELKLKIRCDNVHSLPYAKFDPIARSLKQLEIRGVNHDGDGGIHLRKLHEHAPHLESILIEGSNGLDFSWFVETRSTRFSWLLSSFLSRFPRLREMKIVAGPADSGYLFYPEAIITSLSGIGLDEFRFCRIRSPSPISTVFWKSPFQSNSLTIACTQGKGLENGWVDEPPMTRSRLGPIMSYEDHNFAFLSFSF